MPRLQGKTCVVTGAARGVGRAIATRFGAKAGRSSSPTRTTLRGYHGSRHRRPFHRALCRPGGRPARPGRPRSRRGRVVSNAGITSFEGESTPHDPEHASLENWRAVHRVNRDGIVLGCRYATGAMKARGTGSIINISSRSGLVGIPLAAAYASSKAAIRNHTKTVALYCARQGWTIRCNSIHPAAILTAIWEPMLGTGPDRETRMAALVADTPLRRFGTPEEVASVAAMLAADEASYISGTEINIDGGLLAGSAASP